MCFTSFHGRVITHEHWRNYGGVHGGRTRLSSPCIPLCPWLTLSRGSAIHRWRAGGAAILPAGLPAALHATCAAALPSAVLTDPVLLLWRSLQGPWTYLLLSSDGGGVLCCVSSSVTTGALAEKIQPLFDSVTGVGAQLLQQDFQPARIAAAIRWPDHDVSLLLSAGACLVGDIEESHIFRSGHVTATLSLDGLLASSRESVQAVLKRNLPPPAQATVIWKKTCDEVAAGYIRGPCTAADLDNLWGVGAWTPIVRFLSSRGILLGGSSIMDVRVCRTLLLWRTSGSTRAAPLPVQPFSASSSSIA